MNRSSRYILQMGLATVFIGIGVMILQDPAGWATFIQPWAARLIPGSLTAVMRQTAFLDLGIGVLFLISPLAWIAALLGTIHIAIVLVTTGITMITIRDVGLLAATATFCIETVPASVARRLAFWKKSP